MKICSLLNKNSLFQTVQRCMISEGQYEMEEQEHISACYKQEPLNGRSSNELNSGLFDTSTFILKIIT